MQPSIAPMFEQSSPAPESLSIAANAIESQQQAQQKVESITNKESTEGCAIGHYKASIMDKMGVYEDHHSFNSQQQRLEDLPFASPSAYDVPIVRDAYQSDRRNTRIPPHPSPSAFFEANKQAQLHVSADTDKGEATETGAARIAEEGLKQQHSSTKQQTEAQETGGTDSASTSKEDETEEETEEEETDDEEDDMIEFEEEEASLENSLEEYVTEEEDETTEEETEDDESEGEEASMQGESRDAQSIREDESYEDEDEEYTQNDTEIEEEATEEENGDQTVRSVEKESGTVKETKNEPEEPESDVNQVPTPPVPAVVVEQPAQQTPTTDANSSDWRQRVISSTTIQHYGPASTTTAPAPSASKPIVISTLASREIRTTSSVTQPSRSSPLMRQDPLKSSIVLSSSVGDTSGPVAARGGTIFVRPGGASPRLDSLSVSASNFCAPGRVPLPTHAAYKGAATPSTVIRSTPSRPGESVGPYQSGAVPTSWQQGRFSMDESRITHVSSYKGAVPKCSDGAVTDYSKHSSINQAKIGSGTHLLEGLISKGEDAPGALPSFHRTAASTLYPAAGAAKYTSLQQQGGTISILGGGLVSGAQPTYSVASRSPALSAAAAPIGGASSQGRVLQARPSSAFTALARDHHKRSQGRAEMQNLFREEAQYSQFNSATNNGALMHEAQTMHQFGASNVGARTQFGAYAPMQYNNATVVQRATLPDAYANRYSLPAVMGYEGLNVPTWVRENYAHEGVLSQWVERGAPITIEGGELARAVIATSPPPLLQKDRDCRSAFRHRPTNSPMKASNNVGSLFQRLSFLNLCTAPSFGSPSRMENQQPDTIRMRGAPESEHAFMQRPLALTSFTTTNAPPVKSACAQWNGSSPNNGAWTTSATNQQMTVLPLTPLKRRLTTDTDTKKHHHHHCHKCRHRRRGEEGSLAKKKEEPKPAGAMASLLALFRGTA